MSKEKQIDLVDKFRSELMDKFIDLCRGNDYNKLTLLKIGDTVDQIYDKQIKDILRDEDDYRKQSEGEWEKHIDEYDCEYAKCSCCGEEFYDANGEDTIDMFYNFCPHCGAKMKGGE